MSPSTAPKYLFVYGTLNQEPMRRYLDEFAELVGPATAVGKLYDFGSYPGLVLGGAGDRTHGVLYRIRDIDPLLEALDAYEECTAPDPKYQRVATTVEAESGEMFSAWVYVYAREVGNATRLESGSWPG
jgi:gamma-glutamylcyclotransferase (GGCT)/AIG2-like uncharacterized protein YtfP